MRSFSAFLTDSGAIPTVDCDEKCARLRTEFRYVVYVGKEIYCYWDLKKAETRLDYDALATRLEQSITDATSTSEYFRILRRWASAFHDGHVNVMSKGDMTELEIYTAPVRVEVLAPATDHEKVIIVKVKPGTEGAAVGDEITAINGVAIHDAVTEEAENSASGSTERMRRFSAGRRLVDVLGVDRGSGPLVLSLLSPQGEAKTVALARDIVIDPKPVAGRDDAPEKTGAENLTASILPGSIGYLRIDGFSGSQGEFLLEQAMDRLAGTKGLILDLRKNGGGDLSGNRILARLAESEITRYRQSERLSAFLISARPDTFFQSFSPGGAFVDWHDIKVQPNTPKNYSKPVLAMISPNCFSACDTFGAALKDNRLATFLGEPTGGGTGTPLVFELPVSGFMFRYSVVRGEAPGGGLIEGVGTQPDIYLEPSVEDRMKQKDGQLAKAMEIMGAAIGAPLSTNSRRALIPVQPIWDQRLEVSPTSEGNSDLVRIATIDEI